jgi:acyl carrier protein
MGRTIIEKEDIKKYVENQVESMDYASNYSELDSMDKLELIMRCEAEFFISLNDAEISNHHEWDTDLFIDFVYNKIINKNQ